MKVIYKYALNNLRSNSMTTIPVSHGSKPIHFGKDPDGRICVWIERPKVIGQMHNEQFMIVGTGIEFDTNDNGWKHFQSINDGPFMWHCYHFSRP